MWLIDTRRGLAVSQLVVIMISLASFILLAYALREQISSADSREAEVLCHSSIGLRANAQISIGGEDVKLTPVLCKTIDKKVEGNREEIKEQLATMMARCWWMFNEGRVEEALGNVEISRAVLGIPEANDCFLCYAAPIDEEEIDGGPIGAPEMWKYLKETTYPKSGTTYLDYIQQYGGPGKISILEHIFPGEAYGVVFLAKNKDSSDDSWWTEIVSGAVAVGAVICVFAEPCGAVAVGAALVGVGAAGTATATAISKLYSSDERDVSIITLDSLTSIGNNNCLVQTLGEP